MLIKHNEPTSDDTRLTIIITYHDLEDYLLFSKNNKAKVSFQKLELILRYWFMICVLRVFYDINLNVHYNLKYL